MNKESKEVLVVVRRKYREAQRPTDKVIVKWLGWLAVFLSMDNEDRANFASNDEEVNRTKEALTKDIDGIKYQEVRSTSNNRAIRNSG
jgi:hypothetical protein